MMRTGRFFDLNQLLAIWIEPWVVGDWLKIWRPPLRLVVTENNPPGPTPYKAELLLSGLTNSFGMICSTTSNSSHAKVLKYWHYFVRCLDSLLCSCNWKFHAQFCGLLSDFSAHNSRKSALTQANRQGLLTAVEMLTIGDDRPHPNFSFAPQIICIRRQFGIYAKIITNLKGPVIRLRFEWIIGKIQGLCAVYIRHRNKKLKWGTDIFSKEIRSVSIFVVFARLSEKSDFCAGGARFRKVGFRLRNAASVLNAKALENGFRFYTS